MSGDNAQSDPARSIVTVTDGPPGPWMLTVSDEMGSEMGTGCALSAEARDLVSKRQRPHPAGSPGEAADGVARRGTLKSPDEQPWNRGQDVAQTKPTQLATPFPYATLPP